MNKKKKKLMAYSEKVIEHYEKPRNIGSLDSGSQSVGTGLVGAPECGDVAGVGQAQSVWIGLLSSF